MVHMSRMHSRIDQLDGHTDECFNDEKYAGSKHYWMKGWLGGAYQSYIDAYSTIEESDLSEEGKAFGCKKDCSGCKFCTLSSLGQVLRGVSLRTLFFNLFI